MDAIKQWALTVCITLLGTGIFSMLVPKGSMEKVLKFTLSLFFLTALINPFITNTPQFNYDFLKETDIKSQTKAIEIKASEQMKRLTERNISSHIKLILKEKVSSVNPYNIETSIIVDEDNNVTIEKIIIILDKEYLLQTSTVEQIVKEAVGIKPEIVLT